MNRTCPHCEKDRVCSLREIEAVFHGFAERRKQHRYEAAQADPDCNHLCSACGRKVT